MSKERDATSDQRTRCPFCARMIRVSADDKLAVHGKGPEGIHAALAYLGRECAAADGRALGVLLDPKAYDALVRHYPDAIATQPGGLAVMTEGGTIVVEPASAPTGSTRHPSTSSSPSTGAP